MRIDRTSAMKRLLALAAAFLATLGVAAFASVHIVSVLERQSTTTTYSMQVGRLTRQYEVIAPTATLSKSAPIVVVLSGIAATNSYEINRDRLVPYVNADKTELVYPVAIRESWNAIGCCGAAAQLNVNDLAFLKALVPKVDPGHRRPVYFVGYSNGGRMAYRLECTDPGLFNGMAIVKADPMPGCAVTKPQNVLVLSALDDPWVPFKPGEKGKETPSATVQVGRLHADLGCPTKSVAAKHGDMTLTSWSSCTNGKRLAWAVYTIGGHNFPPPTAHSPSGSQVIWSFFTKTALAPLPS
jgi:polyhydroxybutyrate depolymerase